MKRIEPEYILSNLPCSIVALDTAAILFKNTTFSCDAKKHLTENGYMCLQSMNKLIRQHFKVKTYKYFKREERKLLKEISVEGIAIACVLGHYIVIKDNDYYSFFDNETAPVVAIWFLEEML